MIDQAAQLRREPAALEARDDFESPGAPDVTVIGSGKGGVGKSTIAVLLAAAFARSGRRTLLLDGAQNTGNLHILLGVRPPQSLRAMLAGEAGPADLVVPITGKLSLLPADSGAEHLYGLTAVDRARIHHRLSSVYDAYDHVVVDGGPGLESTVRAAGIRATRLIAIATPEPAALADVYALLKITSFQLPSVPLEVMVNAVLADEEGQAVFDRLSLAARKFLQRDLGWAGVLAEDEGLRRCARSPGALLEERREAIDRIAARLEQTSRYDAAA